MASVLIVGDASWLAAAEHALKGLPTQGVHLAQPSLSDSKRFASPKELRETVEPADLLVIIAKPGASGPSFFEAPQAPRSSWDHFWGVRGVSAHVGISQWASLCTHLQSALDCSMLTTDARAHAEPYAVLVMQSEASRPLSGGGGGFDEPPSFDEPEILVTYHITNSLVRSLVRRQLPVMKEYVNLPVLVVDAYYNHPMSQSAVEALAGATRTIGSTRAEKVTLCCSCLYYLFAWLWWTGVDWSGVWTKEYGSSEGSALPLELRKPLWRFCVVLCVILMLAVVIGVPLGLAHEHHLTSATQPSSNAHVG